MKRDSSLTDWLPDCTLPHKDYINLPSQSVTDIQEVPYMACKVVNPYLPTHPHIRVKQDIAIRPRVHDP